MHAVFRNRGRLYRAQEGEIVAVDKLPAAPGTRLVFDEVLALDDDAGATFGTPLVAGAKVDAEVVGHARDAKAVVFKFRRRNNYRVRRGHRQPYTLVKVLAVTRG